jgi:hypothetical protein
LEVNFRFTSTTAKKAVVEWIFNFTFDFATAFLAVVKSSYIHNFLLFFHLLDGNPIAREALGMKFNNWIVTALLSL